MIYHALLSKPAPTHSNYLCTLNHFIGKCTTMLSINKIYTHTHTKCSYKEERKVKENCVVKSQWFCGTKFVCIYVCVAYNFGIFNLHNKHEMNHVTLSICSEVDLYFLFLLLVLSYSSSQK